MFLESATMTTPRITLLQRHVRWSRQRYPAKKRRASWTGSVAGGIRVNWSDLDPDQRLQKAPAALAERRQRGNNEGQAKNGKTSRKDNER